jgi:hypothetical protein
MNPICYVARFHPIGQGLFFSGNFCSKGEQRFSYVFDCGTISDQDFLKRQIDCFGDTLQNKKIDLVCLSHFHKDHVSGVKRLLTDYGAKVLVLPYVRLADRMILAVEEEADGDFLQFLVDPANYMVGESDTRVVYIKGGPDPSDPPPPFSNDFEDDSSNMSEGDNDSFETTVPSGDASSTADAPIMSAKGTSSQLELLTHDKPIILSGLWEFVFYNEHRSDISLDYFENKVHQMIDQWFTIPGEDTAEGLMKELRALYEDTFGKGGRNANRISLVMYSGPLRSRNMMSHSWYPLKFNRLISECYHYCRSSKTEELPFPLHQSAGILMTGDFYFEKIEAIKEAEKHFTSRRWTRAEILQVPHHGSSYSWFEGAGKEFKNRVSVICAGEGRSNHPGKLVLKDLDSTEIIRVNEYRGCSWISII